MIYEFDFKSFFNNINWTVIGITLGHKSELLRNLILGVIRNIRYIFKDELQDEAELRQWKEDKEIGGHFHINEGGLKSNLKTTIQSALKHDKKVVERFGVPQGLALSPLLASLVVEKGAPKNLVMYADDGLVFGSSKDTS